MSDTTSPFSPMEALVADGINANANLLTILEGLAATFSVLSGEAGKGPLLSEIKPDAPVHTKLSIINSDRTTLNEFGYSLSNSFRNFIGAADAQRS